MTVPYTFANQTGNIPLAELDANFTALDEQSNVAVTVSGNSQPNITDVGTLTYLSSSGNITADYFIGNGAALTGIVAISNYGNSNVAAYLPVDPTIFGINSNIIATNSNVANTNSNVARTNSNVANTNSNVANLTTSLANTNSNVANLAANVITLQGQVYSNANVANYLPIYSGNVSANYFIGDGSLLTNLPSGSNYSNANVASYLPVYTGNIGSGNIGVTGAVTALGEITTFANVVVSPGGFFIGDGNLLANVNAVTLDGAAPSVTNVTDTIVLRDVSGNVEANFFIGDGSQLTNLPAGNYSNANVANYLPTYTGNVGTSNITFTDNTIYSGSAITLPTTTTGILNKFSWNFRDLSVGNDTISLEWNSLTTTFGEFLIGTDSDATPFYFTFDGPNQTLGAIPSSGTTGGGKLTFGAATNNGAGNVNAIELTSSTSNVYVRANNNSWNFDSTGNLTLPTDGNIYYANGALYTTFGNSNVATYLETYTGNIAAGNVTANYFYGDGSNITNLPAGNYSNSNVQSYLGNLTSNVSTTGNVISAYLYGDGSNISNLPAGNYGNANVADYLPTYTGNIGANNVSANFFIGDGGQLSNIALATSIVNGLSNVNIPVADSNVIITVNDGKQWTFDTGGVITLPNGGVTTGLTAGQLSNQAWVAPGEGKVSLLSNDGNNSAYVNDTGITIETDTSNNAYTWNYDIFGNLTLPLGGNIYYANGALYTTYGDSNVATYLETYTGNIAAGNISVTGNIYGNITGNVVATPTYGSFYDTATQTNSNVGNAIPMSVRSVDISNGITVVGTGNTEITIGKTGVYNIQFSAQVNKTGGGADDIYIWLDKNGTSVPNSATALYLVGNNSKTVAAWNFVVSATAGDYYRIMWEAGSSDIEILAEVGAGDVPAIPSVILTVVPVGA